MGKNRHIRKFKLVVTDWEGVKSSLYMSMTVTKAKKTFTSLMGGCLDAHPYINMATLLIRERDGEWYLVQSHLFPKPEHLIEADLKKFGAQ